jgi:membrane-associated phospholipid phosphatase
MAREAGAEPVNEPQAVVEHPTRRRKRAAVFQSFVLIASAAFIALAVAAHFSPYFPIDLVVTRTVQSHQSPALDTIMRLESWIGFIPQADLFVVVTIIGLFLVGLRWEAMAAGFAALGCVQATLIKMAVYRPRPAGDLVHVVSKLDTTSFPSGHVVMATAYCGFLAFLAFTLLKHSWIRTALLVLAGGLIALMGPSRIYLGHHWFSDVMGAYVFGSLWLSLTIHFYRWGKPRFFKTQPVARESTT